MRDLTDFLSHVLPHAPGCPEPAALAFLSASAREWCRRTRTWREIDQFTTAGDEIEVMCAPPFSTLFEIEEARFNGRRLVPVPFRSAPPVFDGGEPDRITQSAPDHVRLIPGGAVGDLWISMFLEPSEGADVVPDFLFDHHARSIAWGALRDIKILPAQPFTDAAAAAVFAARFENDIRGAFVGSVAGRQRAGLRVRSSFL